MIGACRHFLARKPFDARGSIRTISFGDFFGTGGQHRGPSPPPDNEEFYRRLGVDKSATEKEIKSAYKKAALKLHPDKGGDPDKFREISRAYEVLSDASKRKAYDMFGEAGLDESGGGYANPGSVDPMDIFETVFGFSGRGQHAQPRTTQDKRYRLSFTLEDLYTGTSRNVNVVREVVCTECNGEGGKDVRTCKKCDGHGEITRMQSAGPFIQHFTQTCDACKGRGKTIPRGKECKPCVGRGTVKTTETVNIDISPGTQNGTEFRFQGKSDELPGVPSGDLVIGVIEAKHAIFERLGADLIMKRQISLQDALCGFRFRIKYLDGDNLFIGSKAGKVVKPGDVWKVKGKGMPKPHGVTHGDLYISFDVKFPESVHSGERSRELLKELGIDGSTVLPENNSTTEAAPLDTNELAQLREKIRRVASGM